MPLARAEGEPYFDTSAENVLSGDYPLARFLQIYVNKAPNKPIDPLVRESVRYIFSREGQEAVEKDGFGGVAPLVCVHVLLKHDWRSGSLANEKEVESAMSDARKRIWRWGDPFVWTAGGGY